MPKYFLRLTILLAIVTLTASSLPPSLVSAWANDDIQISYEPISLHDYQVDFAAKTMPLRSSVQYRDTMGERKTAPNAPILEGASFRLAYIETIDRWAYAPLGENLYIVTSLKGEYSPQVLPDSNRLIHKVSGSFGNDTVYYSQDFPKILLSNKSDSGMVLSYYPDYDKMTPMLPYADDNGVLKNAYVYRGQAFSRNQRFSIHWMDQSDFIRYDWLTNEAVAFAHWPSFRINPNNLSASGITDDGRYAFINNGEQIYEITSSCGYKIDRLKFKGHITNSYINCPSTTIGVQDYIGKQPPYSDLYIAPGEQQVSFYVKDYFSPVEGMGFRFTLTSADAKTTPDKLTYLALGDSYSSGEGDIGQKPDGSSYYNDGTEDRDLCHLSGRSYPYLLQEKWGILDSQMRSVACSGALVVPDIYGNPSNYLGQKNRLLKYPADLIDKQKAESLNTFLPGIVPQIEFVKKYKPDIITLTGGGNDVGFGEIIRYCASPYIFLGLIPVNETCAYASDQKMYNSLMKTIDDQYTYNYRMVNELKKASPSAKIYIIGYPQFVNTSYLCANNSLILNLSERLMIRDSVSRLNTVLRKVATNTNTTYVDIQDSLDGGQICQGSKYMTGPIKIIAKNKSLSTNQNMYHPNSEGHKKMASAIIKSISESSKVATNEPPLFPDSNDKSIIIKREVAEPIITIGSKKPVKTDPGTFKKNSPVKIELHSTPTSLGTFYTSSDGSLDTTIDIPESVGIGYHLLTITGDNPNGEETQIQQFVQINSNIENDMDGDGIPDDMDNCNFVTEWYEEDVNVCVSPEEITPKGGPNTPQSNNSRAVIQNTKPASILASTSPQLILDNLQPQLDYHSEEGASPSSSSSVSSEGANYDTLGLSDKRDENNLPALLTMLLISALILIYAKLKKRQKDK